LRLSVRPTRCLSEGRALQLPAGGFRGGRDPQRQRGAASGIPAPRLRATRARRRGRMLVVKREFTVGGVARGPAGDAVAQLHTLWPLCGNLPRSSVAAGRASRPAEGIPRSLRRRVTRARMPSARNPAPLRHRAARLDPCYANQDLHQRRVGRGSRRRRRARLRARLQLETQRSSASNGCRAGAPSIFGAGGFGRWVVTHSLASADFHGHRPTVQIRQRHFGIENEPGASAPHARQRFTPHRPLRLPKEAHLARAPTPGRRPRGCGSRCRAFRV